MKNKRYTIKTTKTLDSIVSYFQSKNWTIANDGIVDNNGRVCTHLTLRKNGLVKNLEIQFLPIKTQELIGKNYIIDKVSTIIPIYEKGKMVDTKIYEYYSPTNFKQQPLGFSGLVNKILQAKTTINPHDFLYGDVRLPDISNYIVKYKYTDEYGILHDVEKDTICLTEDIIEADGNKKTIKITRDITATNWESVYFLAKQEIIKNNHSNSYKDTVTIINKQTLEEVECTSLQQGRYNYVLSPINFAFSHKDTFTFDNVDITQAAPITDEEIADLKSYLNPKIEKEAKLIDSLKAEEMRRNWRNFNFEGVVVSEVPTEQFDYLITQLKAYLYDNPNSELKELLESAKVEITIREYDKRVQSYEPNECIKNLKNYFKNSKVMQSKNKTYCILEFEKNEDLGEIDIYLEKIIRFGN